MAGITIRSLTPNALGGIQGTKIWNTTTLKYAFATSNVVANNIDPNVFGEFKLLDNKYKNTVKSAFAASIIST